MTKRSPAAESITLYYKDGSSDKVYSAHLEEGYDPTKAGGGSGLWLVNFAYGRRGATLTTGTKTQAPVPYAAAKKAYDAMVKAKTAKGYTVGESGVPYQHSDKEQRDSGLHPQLLNMIEEAEVERLIVDDNYGMQEKKDGVRMMTRKVDSTVEGINKLGLTRALPQPVEDGLRRYRSDFEADGECVGEILHLFDILNLDGFDHRPLSYKDRYLALMNLVAGNPPAGGKIQLVPTAWNETEKRAMLEALRKANAEGVVFKRLDAPYVAGRPASGGSQLKFKFVATASCIVAKVNAKRSISLNLYDHFQGSELIGVGNCTIPPNYDLPKAGDVVEIRYLYCFPIPGGSLYQPVYQGTRDDIPQEDCTIQQLKFKSAK